MQAAGSSSCSVAACGTGNNFLASVSFSYAAGTSFNATAASAQRAYSSGALQVLPCTQQWAHGSLQAPAAGCICRVSSSTAGSGADAAHAAQNNLNSIQGKQGLLLLGLYQVLDLCSGAVEAGGPGGQNAPAVCMCLSCVQMTSDPQARPQGHWVERTTPVALTCDG